MAKSKPDDPFGDDFGMPEEMKQDFDEMPEESHEDRPPFLKPFHLGKSERGTLELIRVTPETSDYSDVILLVKVGKKTFRLGMKLFSDDYKALKAKFGTKKTEWHGQLQFKVMPHRGNPRGYVAVR